jgi:NAD(P)-dependent dehydrogenase (short-subunit alcohol dehydrogenase family)
MSERALAGQVAVITGGASGIGAAATRVIAGAGAAVAILDREVQGARRVAAEVEQLGGTARVVAIDLADTAAIPGAVAEVLRALGRIDILVNCAGTAGEPATILDLAEKSWDLVHTVNLKAPFLLMQHVARHMVERGGGGRIVNVSSSSAFRARQSLIHYGSSKAALVQLTRSAAAELGRYDINVNAVAPGVTRTPMTAGLEAQGALQRAVTEGPLANLFERVSEPEDVAQAILFLCLPASRQITAQTIHTSAGAVV